MEKHELPQLEAQIKELRANITHLSDPQAFDEFLRIIHHPGYTTVAEHTLVKGIVESMGMQTKNLTTLKQTLLTGARAVGTKAATAG